MYIHALIESSTVNGPGNRALVYVQGCELNCPGCWNQNTHSILGGLSQQPHYQDILSWIMTQAAAGVDGVTFSGGEPMHWAWDVRQLIIDSRVHYPKLSFGMYTGYSIDELENGGYQLYTPGFNRGERYNKWKIWRGIRKRLDFAVMGRYNRLQPTNLPMLSSANQKLMLFSKRYQLTDFRPQEFEFNLHEDGMVQITGFPPMKAQELLASPAK